VHIDDPIWPKSFIQDIRDGFSKSSLLCDFYATRGFQSLTIPSLRRFRARDDSLTGKQEFSRSQELAQMRSASRWRKRRKRPTRRARARDAGFCGHGERTVNKFAIFSARLLFPYRPHARNHPADWLFHAERRGRARSGKRTATDDYTDNKLTRTTLSSRIIHHGVTCARDLSSQRAPAGPVWRFCTLTS